MYGYTAEEIIGQPITVLCPPDRVAEIQEILGKIRDGQRVSYHETTRRRKNGTIFPVSVTVPRSGITSMAWSARRRSPATSLSGTASRPSFASGQPTSSARTRTWEPAALGLP